MLKCHHIDIAEIDRPKESLLIMNVAIVIAVEDYADAAIPKFQFAQNDADGFSAAVGKCGFDSADQIVLVNSLATKTTVESKLRTVIGSLTKDDVLFFFYAGHGFSKDETNYITCYDSQSSDLEMTSIELRSVLEQIRDSKSKQSVIFLDSCQRGLLADSEVEGVYADLSQDKLIEFFDSNDRCGGFASCMTGQQSWPSGQVKHGAWTYNVIEAFKGNAKTALENGQNLTPSSLQGFLGSAVEQTLSNAYSDKKEQTPFMFGLSGKDCVLADLTELLARRQNEANVNSEQLVNTSLLRKQHGQVRSLSGFKKNQHKVPDSVSDRSEMFVASISADEIKDDLEEKFLKLRKAFGFKRAELSVAHEGEGAGTIVTPLFNYSISIALDPDDSSSVIWRRAVDAIKAPEEVFSDSFAEVFGAEFDTIEFSIPNACDLEEFIDQVEALEDDSINVSYDMDVTSCFLTVENVEGKIELTSQTLSIVKANPMQPRLIFESFFEIQRSLIETHGVRAIRFDDAVAAV